MKLIEPKLEMNYLQNYLINNDEESWKKVVSEIKNKSLPKDNVGFALETLVQKNENVDKIKLLFEYDEKRSVKHPDLYKWACAFADPGTIEFLEKKMIVKDEYGAINAAIINFRSFSLNHLIKNGYNVLTLSNFSKAVIRSQTTYQKYIIDIFIENFIKTKTLAPEHIEELKKSWLATSNTYPDYIKTVELALLEKQLNNNLPIGNNKKQNKI